MARLYIRLTGIGVTTALVGATLGAIPIWMLPVMIAAGLFGASLGHLIVLLLKSRNR